MFICIKLLRYLLKLPFKVGPFSNRRTGFIPYLSDHHWPAIGRDLPSCPLYKGDTTTSSLLTLSPLSPLSSLCFICVSLGSLEALNQKLAENSLLEAAPSFTVHHNHVLRVLLLLRRVAVFPSQLCHLSFVSDDGLYPSSFLRLRACHVWRSIL